MEKSERTDGTEDLVDFANRSFRGKVDRGVEVRHLRMHGSADASRTTGESPTDFGGEGRRAEHLALDGVHERSNL